MKVIVDEVHDESFRRVVGRRERAASREVPSAMAREAMAKMARYRTAAPKGVFRYASHEEANADREAWIIAFALTKAEDPR